MRDETRFASGFLVPGGVWLLALFVTPLVFLLAISFGYTDDLGEAIYSTRFDNYSRLVDPDYLPVLFRSVGFALACVAICLLIGYPVAYFLARHAGRARGWLLALFLAPFWISYMLRMTAWIGLLEEEGLVNRILERLGFIDAPIGFLSGHAATLIAGLIYGYVPFMILPLFAVLDRIPASNLEAARDLGASPTQTFLRVTLPASRQGLIAGAILCALPMFGDYFTQQLLANANGTRMLGNFIVESLQVPIFVARGASLILLLVVLLTVPIVYYLRSAGRAARERA